MGMMELFPGDNLNYVSTAPKQSIPVESQKMSMMHQNCKHKRDISYTYDESSSLLMVDIMLS